jgi:hypothetical protein
MVECLNCGFLRLRADVECPRCAYVGWALADDLTEQVRRTLRDNALERRSRLRAVLSPDRRA